MIFRILLVLVLIFVVSCNTSYSQDTNIIIGKDLTLKTGSTIYNFANPNKVNFEIIIWGGVSNPGKYIIPEGTTLIDVLTYAGASKNMEGIENFKLIRGEDVNGKYTTTQVLYFNYSDLLKKEQVSSFVVPNPSLRPGDIIIFPTEVDKDFWVYFTQIMSVVTPLLTIISLYITIKNNN